MEMEKGKRIETPLPEAMIQHIQSFLTAKEAAQTTLLSKSWYNAWLTRPTLAFNQRDFKNLDWRSYPAGFSEFATTTMLRYHHLNLRIESLRLQTQSSRRSIDLLSKKLIVDAIEMGATDLDLEFRPSKFLLPREVLRSETLLRLSVSGCQIDGNVNFSNLKSLSLDSVLLKSDDMIRDLVSCCMSIEELSLSNSSNSKPRNLSLSGENLQELHKLRRLFLENVDVDNSFFVDFNSRFPCLKELSLVRCHGYRGIHISSTSLRRITIVQPKVLRGEFDIPNLTNFSYSGMAVPSLSIEAKEWELCMSMQSHHSLKFPTWYLSLHKLLTHLSPSKITLSINSLVSDLWRSRISDVGHVEVVGEPLAVENLTIEAIFDLGCDLLVGFLCICRPKFVTHYWLPRDSFKCWEASNWSLEKLYKKLITPDCSVPDQNLFWRFEVKEVNVEVYEEILKEWRPLLLKEPLDAGTAPPNKRKIRFQLNW